MTKIYVCLCVRNESAHSGECRIGVTKSLTSWNSYHICLSAYYRLLHCVNPGRIMTIPFLDCA